MEEKVLFNVLKQVSKGEALTAAPNDSYIKALETIGLIKNGWDRELTSFGHTTLQQLRSKLETW